MYVRQLYVVNFGGSINRTHAQALHRTTYVRALPENFGNKITKTITQEACNIDERYLVRTGCQLPLQKSLNKM